MKTTIFFKIFAGFLMVAGITIFSIVVITFNQIGDLYTETLSKQFLDSVYVIKDAIENRVLNRDLAALRQWVERVAKERAVVITVVDNKGVVLADSNSAAQKTDTYKHREEIAVALQGKEGRSIRYNTVLGRTMLYIALPIYQNSRLDSVVRVGMAIESKTSFINALKLKIGYVSLGVILLSLLVSSFFYFSISKPIRRLTKASEEVANGNLNMALFVSGSDELKNFTENFNRMIERIRGLFADLSDQKNELDVILHSIPDAVLVIDEQERVILFNDTFRKIFGREIIGQDYYWNVLREPLFQQMFNLSIEEKRTIAGEVTIHERIYAVRLNYIGINHKVVILFHDMTEVREVERIKREFTTNVSHELKTPLTAIKGYVETLEEGLTGENLEYLEIVKRHTQRLIQIVEQLLILDSLESDTFQPDFTKVKVNEFFPNILRVFQRKFQEKGLGLTMDIARDLPAIKADPFLLESLFVNLVDNAYKYTEQGGVTIRANREENRLAISVEDTGIGIPEEDRQRIFERFYVVDKSRSRGSGGTGLGLAIVKHIALLHSAKLTVESRKNRGTSFSLRFPLA